MKRLFGLLLLLCSFAHAGQGMAPLTAGPWSGGGGGGVAPTVGNNSVNDSAGATATVAVAMGSNVTSPNVVVCAVPAFGNPAWTTPPVVATDLTKTAGTSTIGTITLDAVTDRTTGGTQGNYINIFSIPVTGSGSLTLTFAARDAVGASTFIVVRCVEVTNMDATGSRVNGSPATSNAAGPNTTAVTGTVSTGGAGIIFGLVNPSNPYGTQTMTTPTNYTLIGEMENDAQQNYSFVYRSTTTDITDSPTWTIGTSSSWLAGTVAYKSTTP